MPRSSRLKRRFQRGGHLGFAVKVAWAQRDGEGRRDSTQAPGVQGTQAWSCEAAGDAWATCTCPAHCLRGSRLVAQGPKPRSLPTPAAFPHPCIALSAGSAPMTAVCLGLCSSLLNGLPTHHIHPARTLCLFLPFTPRSHCSSAVILPSSRLAGLGLQAPPTADKGPKLCSIGIVSFCPYRCPSPPGSPRCSHEGFIPVP